MFNAATIWVLIPITALCIPIVAILAGVLKEKYRAQQSVVTDSEREQLQELINIADRLTERVATLEAILDAEVPDWRDDHERNQ